MADGRDDQGRFLPGVSGNPAGKPKFSIVSIIKEKLERVPKGARKSVVEQMVEAYIVKALDDGVAFRDLMDRFDGKPHQILTVNSEQDGAWLEFLKSVRAEPEQEAEGDST